MSRIANNPIKISKEVECTFRDGIFSAKGKLGQMQTRVNSNYNININDNEIKVTPNIENNKEPIMSTPPIVGVPTFFILCVSGPSSLIG